MLYSRGCADVVQTRFDKAPANRPPFGFEERVLLSIRQHTITVSVIGSLAKGCSIHISREVLLVVHQPMD